MFCPVNWTGQPRLNGTSSLPGRGKPTGDPQTPPRQHLTFGSRSLELRLRRRIDGLLEQRARKERWILHLEERLRDAALPEGERVLVLERRLEHLNRRVIDLHERLREARTS